MEKLIELLDLYRRENKTEELFGEPGTLVLLTGKDFIMINRIMIISKEYGFIKWLVDNDKIDKSLRNAGIELYHTSYNMYEAILMLLSISDTPIDDLISYLK